jgi:hypothetical protein
LEIHSTSIWGTPSQASKRKYLPLVRKLQAMDHYPHHGDAHWQQERCRWNKWWQQRNQQCLTENEVTPSVADALYVLRTVVARKFPVVFVLLTYVNAIILVPFAKLFAPRMLLRLAAGQQSLRYQQRLL